MRTWTVVLSNPKGLAYILKETKRILQLSYLLSTRIIRMQLWAGGGGVIYLIHVFISLYVQSWWCFSLTFINIHKFNLILPKPSHREVVAIEFFLTVCLYCLNLLHVFILSNLSFIFQYSCELSSNIGKNASTSGQPENSGCREDLWSCRRLIVQTINTLGMTKTNISRIFSKGDCHKLYFNLKKVNVYISMVVFLSSYRFL